MDADLAAPTKHVLHVISTYMNSHGEGAFPTIETIADKSGLSVRTVKNHIPLAVDSGWLIKTKIGLSGQQWANNKYEICMPKGSAASSKGSAAKGNKVVQELHTNTPLNTPLTKIIIKDFEIWWKRYPRKVGKDAALRKYEKAVVEKRITEKLLLQALDRIIPVWKDMEREFIPHPATWLHGGRWNDEVKKEKESWML